MAKSDTVKGHSRQKLDLTGQRFGNLSVLRPAENINGRTAWVCACDCGRERTATTRSLREGKATSCGCGDRSGGPLGLTYIDGTCVEMLAKRPVRANNTSGTTGVEWRPSKNSWRATICFKGKRYYLGSYKDLADAVKARKRAEEDLFEKFLGEYASNRELIHNNAQKIMSEGGIAV